MDSRAFGRKPRALIPHCHTRAVAPVYRAYHTNKQQTASAARGLVPKQQRGFSAIMQPARLPAAAAAAAAANPAAAPSPDEMARRWLAMDNDPASRAAVEALLEKGDAAALSALFCSRLEFGAPQKRGFAVLFRSA